jgi:acyl-coenzyme A synthetase/AMP-(fatty) acid ligase
MKSFKELLLWAESGYGAKPAIVDLDRNVRWSYADLNRAARSICAAYAQAGLVKNDRIGWLAMAPGADVTALSIGARKMGVIPVVMNARASVDRLAWMINNIGIKALAYTAETADLLGRIQAVGIPSVELFIAMDDPVSEGHLALREIYEKHPNAAEPEIDIAPDDAAFVIYTSGSTGQPKPIVHTEAGYLETSMNMAYAWAMTHDDRFLSIMPPHFAGWLGVTTAVLRAAASQVCVRFDPGKVARAIADERCSHAVMSPTMVRILRGAHEANPSLFAGNDMRAGMLGGEVITPDVMDILFEMFPKFQLMGSLGATEAAIAHTGVGHPRVKTDDGRLVGRPMPGVIVELRDTDTGEVITEPHRTGEMFVRGPIAQGVWGDPEATAANFPNGWWRSKDLLYRDEEGFLYFAGRADNLFKSGGIKVSCEDVESMLKAHPQVLDAVVVPVPDERLGSVAHAFVRHREGLESGALDAWWRERTDAEPYARPRHWTLMGAEPFPMVTAAKVDRSGLRKRALTEGSR